MIREWKQRIYLTINYNVMKQRGYVFKTKTDNGRLSKTCVWMPRHDIVVINQRILAKESDIKDGWFTNGFPIFTFKDYVLMEVELVLWVESFKMIQKAFSLMYPTDILL
jgi:hypothetical protein